MERIHRNIVELRRVEKYFGTDSHRTSAIRGISLKAQSGELLLILGPSGSGKTTLLTLIAGMIQPTSGQVMLYGKNIEHYLPRELQRLRAHGIGFVFQSFHLIEGLTSAENIALAVQFAGHSAKEAMEKSLMLLDGVHLSCVSEKFPSELSQGEKQRVAVARAIANGSALILADEPTSSLESSQGLEVIELLHFYAKVENKCVIVASHDLRLVDHADRVIKLQDGLIWESMDSRLRKNKP